MEAVEASLDDYARALHGIRSNPSAGWMVAATEALGSMIGDVWEPSPTSGATRSARCADPDSALCGASRQGYADFTAATSADSDALASPKSRIVLGL